MRHTIEITRHNCPADGDSITAEVTLDVTEGVTSDTTDDCASPTVTHVATRAVQMEIDGETYAPSPGAVWASLSRLAESILARECDPVQLAIEKLTELQGSGGAE